MTNRGLPLHPIQRVYSRKMTVDEPSANRRGARLAGVLDRAREQGFVGRVAQRESFGTSLSGAGSRLHLVHGPGGIGKTALLETLARQAAREGLRVAYLDAREVACSESAVTAALGENADVLLVDDYQLLEPLDDWFRKQLLPTLPETSVTVLAGRSPPRLEWSLDPGWRSLVQIHELDVLDFAESSELLAKVGVPESDRGPLARLGRGHPLALAMLGDVASAGIAPAQLSDAPDVVATLCRMIVDDIPDLAHRAGLATCAHASRMTHDLLVHTVGVRADEVWSWLEARPYVHRGEVGLFVHDVVREIFEAEFAQRAPGAFSDLHRRVKVYFRQRLADPHETHPDRAAAELLMLSRKGPMAEQAGELREGGLIPIARATSHDHAEIADMIAEGEGPESAALAVRWMKAQPGSIYRARSDTGVIGFAMQIYLPVDDEGLETADPVAAAILRAVEEHGPLRPGERINVNRFAGASSRYQRHPLVLLVNGVSCILEWGREQAAWTFIVIIEDELYGPYFEYIGLQRMFSLDYFGHPLVGYGWDRRRFPVASHSELMARRELSGESGPPPSSMLRAAPLSAADFAAAARDALVALGRPDRLSDSPLLESALVDPGTTDPVGELTRVLLASISGLADEPRGDEHRRVLERTYLRGAPSQEVAAELLGLTFSTFRRRLAAAQERFIEVLWAIEIGVRRPPAASE
jgi:hypothetical protein